MSDVFKVVDQVIRWVSPIVAVIISLLVFIYRSKIRELENEIEDEKEARIIALSYEKEARKNDFIKEQEARLKDFDSIFKIVETNEAERKVSQKELLVMFKDGLKEEREFRTDMIIKQANQIDKIFEKIEDVLISISTLNQRLESHIDTQERICQLNHKKDNEK